MHNNQSVSSNYQKSSENLWSLNGKSSHRGCSVRKDVLRSFANFTGKHLCQSFFFNKVAGLQHLLYRTPLGDYFCNGLYSLNIRSEIWRRSFTFFTALLLKSNNFSIFSDTKIRKTKSGSGLIKETIYKL